jgi:hypothetical protein
VVSDALNHASIIDGIRLCKARRYRYANADMDDLEVQLTAARADGARTIMIATDGVFSMDGYLAPLPEITALAERYDAIVMVDDCHATGFMGPRAAARRTTSAWRTRSISSPARSARRSAGPSAATSPGRGPSSTSCGSARGPTSSPTRCPPPSAPPGSPRLIL